MSDSINPDYYRKGIETTDYIQSHSMNYLEGNIIKYTITSKGRQVIIPKEHSDRADELYLEADQLINKQESDNEQ